MSFKRRLDAWYEHSHENVHYTPSFLSVFLFACRVSVFHITRPLLSLSQRIFLGHRFFTLRFASSAFSRVLLSDTDLTAIDKRTLPLRSIISTFQYSISTIHTQWDVVDTTKPLTNTNILTFKERTTRQGAHYKKTIQTHYTANMGRGGYN